VRVGFLGLGQMGGSMCDHVLSAGHTVAVHDPSEPAVAPRAASGARVATSPADAASDAEVVCVVVRDDAESRIAIADAGTGVVAGASPGAVVLLHSTVAPATVRELAGVCAAAGLRFVDAGISGGAPGAAAGTLYLMCGGDPAAIDAARPVLDCYADHVVRFGDLGAGMAAKLARNLAFYSAWTALHEAQLLAEAAGLDLAAFHHLCATTDVPAVIDYVLGRSSAGLLDPAAEPDRAAAARHTIGLGWKDLAGALALAHELDVDIPVAAVVRRTWGPATGLPVEPPG
jgi:3-hydroxyisobutyrate dehydrogenase-like beta-hydroxyacid dehydrogenase